jgi:predicted RecA/RadA family phage recombinase
MKKSAFKRMTMIALLIIAVLFCFTIGLSFAQGISGPNIMDDPSGLLPLALLPFLFGAVKVREAMQQVKTVVYTHTSATVKDTIYLFNGIPMLAINSADANVSNIFAVVGVIEYAKVSAQAWTAGQKIYWDNGNSQFTTASSGNTLAGIAMEPAANPSSTGIVFLCPFLVGTNALENTVTDPGDGGAIPVTASGVCAMTSAGAETRTLAAPTYLGQQLALIDDTHVGNIVVTAASAVNQTGNNTLTFGAAADACLLVAMSVGGSLVWRVMGNDGVALSTV